LSLTCPAGYSPENSPHLTPALELDSTMIEFSTDLASRGLPNVVKSDEDLHTLMAAFEQTLKKLDLWQFYVLQPSRERESVFSALCSDEIALWTGPPVEGKSVVELAQIVRSENKIVGISALASRFGVHIRGDVAASIVKAAFVDLQDYTALADAWVRIVDVINVPLYQEWEDDTRVALENICNRIRYTRLDAQGPKLGEITRK